MSDDFYLDGSAYHMIHIDNLASVLQRRALISKEKVQIEELEEVFIIPATQAVWIGRAYPHSCKEARFVFLIKRREAILLIASLLQSGYM